MPNVGDIGVRTSNRASNHLLGTMYRADRYCKDGFPYNTIYSIDEGNYRMATDIEIEAYNQGIRNINDIPDDFKIPKKEPFYSIW